MAAFNSVIVRVLECQKTGELGVYGCFFDKRLIRLPLTPDGRRATLKDFQFLEPCCLIHPFDPRDRARPIWVELPYEDIREGFPGSIFDNALKAARLRIPAWAGY